MATNVKRSTKQVELTTNNGTAIEVSIEKALNGVRSVSIQVSGLDFVNTLATYENKVDRDKTQDQTIAGDYIEKIDDCIQLLTNLKKFVEDETKISS